MQEANEEVALSEKALLEITSTPDRMRRSTSWGGQEIAVEDTKSELDGQVDQSPTHGKQGPHGNSGGGAETPFGTARVIGGEKRELIDESRLHSDLEHFQRPVQVIQKDHRVILYICLISVKILIINKNRCTFNFKNQNYYQTLNSENINF